MGAPRLGLGLTTPFDRPPYVRSSPRAPAARCRSALLLRRRLTLLMRAVAPRSCCAPSLPCCWRLLCAAFVCALGRFRRPRPVWVLLFLLFFLVGSRASARATYNVQFALRALALRVYFASVRPLCRSCPRL